MKPAPANRRYPDLINIHHLIQAEVESLGASKFDVFQARGSFVFLEDPFGELLEPAFDSKRRPYGTIDAVSTNYGSLDEVRKNSQTVEDAGIATVAYQDGYAFSQNPEADIRFGNLARSLHSRYEIAGSLLALKLEDECRSFLGVIVVHSDAKFEGISLTDEQRMSRALDERSIRLRFLLQLRREELSRQELEGYQRFLASSLRNSRTPRTVSLACADFVQICKPLFATDTFFVSITGCGDGPWVPSMSPQQQAALDSLKSYCDDVDVLTLNRQRQAPSVFEVLSPAFGPNLVWCRVQQNIGSRTIVCIAGRRATSISDHWQPCHVALLKHALEVLASQLSRSEQFDQLLSHLAKDGESTSKQDQFDFLAHLLNDYFGFDQVLLTKVKRKPKCYKVCTDAVAGFGHNQGLMKSRPKEYSPGVDVGGHPDVMVRILADFCNRTMAPLYEAVVGIDNPRYSLDSVLNTECNIKGHVYFIPCCSHDEIDGDTLESILHVGSIDGQTTLTAESLPLVITLSKRVAEWLVNERHHESARIIRDIRNIDSCDHATFDTICKMVANATASLGCTLFLNASELQLLGLAWASEEGLSEGLLRLVNRFELWETLLGTDGSEKMTAMFSAFMGIDLCRAKSILRGPAGKHVARLASSALYVRVCQSNSPGSLNELGVLLETMDSTDRVEWVKRFGSYIATNAYLPGYGLTGWVLRYRQQMALADKHFNSIADFHHGIRDLVGPAWSLPIKRMLKMNGIAGSSLETDSCPVPVHADHISEDPLHQLPHDSYLACPIQGIDALEKPLGVLRISNSASMRHRFTEDDEATVMGASRHISNLLRREYMRQEAYLAEILDRRGDEDDFYHCIFRLNEKIIDLRRIIHSPDICLSADDRSSLESTVNRLAELCDSALAGPQLRVHAWRINQADTAGMPLSGLAVLLKEWLDTEHVAADCVFESQKMPSGLSPVVVTLAFRVVVELVRNLRRHQKIQKPVVSLRTEVLPVFYVGDERALECTVSADWKPYLNLVEGKESGGGTRLIRAAIDWGDFEVEFANVTVAEKLEMITRIRPRLT